MRGYCSSAQEAAVDTVEAEEETEEDGEVVEEEEDGEVETEVSCMV